MPYVQRIDGKIAGRFVNLQEGYAEEWLDDDHPDLQLIESDLVLQKINDLEGQQFKCITPCFMQEFILSLINQSGTSEAPAFIELKSIEDKIKILRQKL